VVLVEVFDVGVPPLRASLAVTVKGPKTIKVWRLYGFGPKSAPIRTRIRSLAHKLFYDPHTHDTETKFTLPVNSWCYYLGFAYVLVA
jgi:hypothetical protein